MKRTLMTMLALYVAALCGCTSTHYEPPTYDSKHSRAYNIAEAGGLVTGIQDATVPRDKLERLTDTKTFGTAYALSGYISPQFGMTSWQGGLLNLANWAIGPKLHGARSSLIAWMPVNEAVSPTEAQAKMLSHVKVAIESALSGLDADFSLVYEKNGSVVYHFYKNEWACPTWVNDQSDIDDMCSIEVKMIEPLTGTAPGFISGVKGSVYAFTSGHETQYNKIVVTDGVASHTPQKTIYTALSKQLPDGVYLYLAPKTVKLQNGDKVAFPYLLEKGHPEFFVYPNT